MEVGVLQGTSRFTVIWGRITNGDGVSILFGAFPIITGGLKIDYPAIIVIAANFMGNPPCNSQPAN